MRVKLSGEIVSKTNINKKNYHNGTYAMILGKLDEPIATRIHDQHSREYRLLTFSNIYINKDKFHLYISGEDNLINNFLENIEKDNIVRVEDMILSINKASLCKELVKKEKYLFKGRIIATEVIDRKKRLLVSDKDINNKLKSVSQGKLKSMGIDGDIQFDILKKEVKTSVYKTNIHIQSYEVLVLVSGNYEAIKAVYEVGIGENTASGHGLLWEV